MIFSFFFHAVRHYKNVSKSLDVISNISIELQNNTAIGGGNTPTFDAEKLASYVQLGVCKKDVKYKFETHTSIVNAPNHLNDDKSSIFCQLPMSLLVTRLTLKQLRSVATLHNVHISNRVSLCNSQNILESHTCNENCRSLGSIFKIAYSHADRDKIQYQKLSSVQKEKRFQKMSEYQSTAAYKESHKKAIHKLKHKNAKFPPSTTSDKLEHKIILDFCNDTSPSTFMESGCAVCGGLTQYSDLTNISDVKNIKILAADGVTRLERKKYSYPILEKKCPNLE
jgi:hypothetical protein